MDEAEKRASEIRDQAMDEARADAELAMESWADCAGDGWDELSTQVCYGRVTHAVRVETIEVTDENRHLVPSSCDGLEDHHLEPIGSGKQ